jgi:hypothetical protein
MARLDALMPCLNLLAAPSCRWNAHRGLLMALNGTAAGSSWLPQQRR